MSDQSERPDRPVTDGLIALAVVAVAVGLVLAIAAFAGAKIMGFGDGGGGGGGTAEQERLSIPPIEDTGKPSGPEITLHTETPKETESAKSEEPTEEKSTEPTEEESDKEAEISLSAGQTEVGNFERIDLTGIYPGGEGSVLQVQRFEDGRWRDFNATVSVSNETFSTYIQTGVNGVNRFRVIDESANVKSNEVKVTVRG